MTFSKTAITIPALTVGMAVPRDVERISALLWAAAPLCIPMSADEVRGRLGEFDVVREPFTGVVASAAVRRLDARRVELRGLCVDPAWRGGRLGALLVVRAIERATAGGDALVCVTQTEGFFRRLGFRRIPLSEVPDKPGSHPELAVARRVAMTWDSTLPMAADAPRPRSYAIAC